MNFETRRRHAGPYWVPTLADFQGMRQNEVDTQQLAIDNGIRIAELGERANQNAASNALSMRGADHAETAENNKTAIAMSDQLTKKMTAQGQLMGLGSNSSPGGQPTPNTPVEGTSGGDSSEPHWFWRMLEFFGSPIAGIQNRNLTQADVDQLNTEEGARYAEWNEANPDNQKTWTPIDLATMRRNNIRGSGNAFEDSRGTLPSDHRDYNKQQHELALLQKQGDVKSDLLGQEYAQGVSGALVGSQIKKDETEFTRDLYEPEILPLEEAREVFGNSGIELDPRTGWFGRTRAVDQEAVPDALTDASTRRPDISSDQMIRLGQTAANSLKKDVPWYMDAVNLLFPEEKVGDSFREALQREVDRVPVNQVERRVAGGFRGGSAQGQLPGYDEYYTEAMEDGVISEKERTILNFLLQAGR